MGLTAQSSGVNLLRESFNIDGDKNNPVVALAGNPNTGKSTVFNGLTGLKQHTGNWPGKTVTQAKGYYTYLSQEYTVVDLPGTYSLLASSIEEQIARDFICFAQPEVTVVIADATNLERNLNLLLQVTELSERVVLCLNLMDEAERKNIKIDLNGLATDLQVPIVPTIARDEKGLSDLKKVIDKIVNQEVQLDPIKIKYSSKIEEKVEKIVPELNKQFPNLRKNINIRWLALRLLEGDRTIFETLEECYDVNLKNKKVVERRQ
ncbi:FeoB small GTPase domain-containing protein [Halanaerobacter jeridensis]|uniref:Fe2+ transport system protein B n=1 Tax=Halanaerobacter jeridensis TaxID=706427 RepID=A0A938XTN1_9FIRM|nr:FeoB small GTPase domain-containing protein [Halanaerobacter jeridensis]MBM7557320.1 Fe2+ transport system protein B [Halanaerobacter jeridensis]